MSKPSFFRGARVEHERDSVFADARYRVVLADGRATDWRVDLDELVALATVLIGRPVLASDVRALPRKAAAKAA